MNNKKPILIVVVVLVLIFGAVAFALVFKPKSSPTAELANPSKLAVTENKPQNEETFVKGSLLDLIKLGKTARCTYSSDQDGYITSGVSYISGKNVRVDFDVTTADDQEIKSHMVTDGEWVYTWSTATPQGFKMKVDQPENTSTDTTKEAPTKALNESFDYKCTPWLVDNSLFEIPSDIEFTDFSTMMEGLKDNNACSACDYIPDAEGKATCKQQLGCE
jgi:hypothetical protein